jgi:hypothetical protein
MNNFKKIVRFFRLVLFAFMLSVCMVLGIAPVLPKRKEEISIEIKIDRTEKKENTTAGFNVEKN